MGNDTLGTIVLAQLGYLIDAENEGWTVKCKNRSDWETIPTDFRPTTECNEDA